MSLTFHYFPSFFLFMIRKILSKDKNTISERISTHCVPKMCHALLVLMTQQMLNIQLSSLTKLVFYCFDVKSFSSKILNSCVLMIISSDLEMCFIIVDLPKSKIFPFVFSKKYFNMTTFLFLIQ